MPKILLTPENLKAEATKLENTAAKNDDVLSKLDNLINGLVEGWEGEAQAAFINSYNSKKESFKKFTEEMKEFVEFMRHFAQVMEDQESLQKAKAAGLAQAIEDKNLRQEAG